MEQVAGKPLEGKRVAMLLTDGVEQIEYTSPRSFLEERGATVVLLAPKSAGERIQGFNQLEPADTFQVEMNVADANPTDFDALLLPGGVANPDMLRLYGNVGPLLSGMTFMPTLEELEHRITSCARAGQSAAS